MNSKNKLYICCPQCDATIVVEVEVNPSLVPNRRKGPKPYDLGPEVDTFVIDAVENRRLTYRTIGDLLQEQRHRTAKGGARWYAATVKTYYEQARKRKDVTETPN